MSSDDEYYYDSSDTEDNFNGEFKCTNMDPALAKIMGIFIQEQVEEKSDWKPPLHSGLSNSERIIKNEEKKCDMIECKTQDKSDIFESIKNKIRNFDKLLQNEIDYMKTFSNQQKLELIRIYNNIINNIIND
jgi:hypothetical protein